jgi:hypothetical protein
VFNQLGIRSLLNFWMIDGGLVLRDVYFWKKICEYWVFGLYSRLGFWIDMLGVLDEDFAFMDHKLLAIMHIIEYLCCLLVPLFILKKLEVGRIFSYLMI